LILHYRLSLVERSVWVAEDSHVISKDQIGRAADPLRLPGIGIVPKIDV
jgi:hypothetical protein